MTFLRSALRGLGRLSVCLPIILSAWSGIAHAETLYRASVESGPVWGGPLSIGDEIWLTDGPSRLSVARIALHESVSMDIDVRLQLYDVNGDTPGDLIWQGGNQRIHFDGYWPYRLDVDFDIPDVEVPQHLIWLVALSNPSVQTTMPFLLAGDEVSHGQSVRNWSYSPDRWRSPSFGLASIAQFTGAVVWESIPGDANRDGRVDKEDAAALATNWGQSGGWAEGDFDDDGLVSAADASILAAHWGQTAEKTAPVPEPTVVVILFSLTLAGIVGRRRERAILNTGTREEKVAK